MEKLYKNHNVRGDNNIYVGDPDVVDIPSGFVEVITIYHVRECEPGEACDYSTGINVANRTPYVFSSQKGLEAWAKGGSVSKVSDPNAVTCPECLVAIGLGDRVKKFEVSVEAEEGIE